MDDQRVKIFKMVYTNDYSALESFQDCVDLLSEILQDSHDVREREGELFLIEIRQLVKRVAGMKVEIYSDEHPPPHFHVKGQNINASFSIESCELLQGNITSKNRRKIEYWHSKAKKILISTWNNSRPSDCSVGAYLGS